MSNMNIYLTESEKNARIAAREAGADFTVKMYRRKNRIAMIACVLLMTGMSVWAVAYMTGMIGEGYDSYEVPAEVLGETSEEVSM